MEQVDKAAIVAELRRLNPRYSVADIAIYVDALAEYREAQANIDQHGSIVMHPRTGAPIENPYLTIRNKAGAVIGKHARLNTGSLWAPVTVAPAEGPKTRKKR